MDRPTARKSSRFLAVVCAASLSVGTSSAGELCKIVATSYKNADRFAFSSMPYSGDTKVRGEGEARDAITPVGCENVKDKYYVTAAQLKSINPAGNTLSATKTEGTRVFNATDWLLYLETSNEDCDKWRHALANFQHWAGDRSVIFIEYKNTGFFGAAWSYYQYVYNGTCKKFLDEVETEDLASGTGRKFNSPYDWAVKKKLETFDPAAKQQHTDYKQ